MKITMKRHALLFCAALAVTALTFAHHTQAAQSETIILQEKGIASETVVAPKAPTTAGGLAKAVPPFTGKRELLPAGTAVVGTEIIRGELVPEVISYASAVTKKTPEELVLSTTISGMTDDATLSRLAGKVYMENGGPKYNNVTIFWHLGENPEPSKPWARTDIAKGDTVYEIVRIQYQ